MQMRFYDFADVLLAAVASLAIASVLCGIAFQDGLIVAQAGVPA